MRRALSLLRSPAVKWGFLVVALGFIVWFVWRNATEIGAALGRLHPIALAVAFALSIAYVLTTLEAWRAVLGDLGDRVSFRAAVPLFGVSQLGKYIPGGVWNIAAAAELGRAHGIPRRHSVAAMTIALLVSIVTGAAVGALAFLASPAPLFAQWGWVLWLAIPLTACLLPPVMNRLIALAWRMAKLEPLETTISSRGIGVVTAWSVLAWVLAGASVGALAVGLGAEASLATLLQCVGGYALAWVAGFLFVVAPAGAGVREVVLAAVLAGSLGQGEIVAIVLLSRIILTAVDLAVAGIGALDLRITQRRDRRPHQ
ncbi:MAG: lysylphosphatidylglycerol synthase transmembrane domain-containing protein [Microbacterium sp.]